MLFDEENCLKITRYVSALIFLFAFVNLAQAQDEKFSTWDKDGNDEISEKEFKESFAISHYSKWDENKDDRISSDEFYLSTFKIVDHDGDNKLSISERDWGFERVYGDYVNYEVTKEKEKESDTANYEQYRESVKDTDFYSAQDKNSDKNLDKSELSVTVFHMLDKNGDGALSSDEFSEYKRYYLSDENQSS